MSLWAQGVTCKYCGMMQCDYPNCIERTRGVPRYHAGTLTVSSGSTMTATVSMPNSKELGTAGDIVHGGMAITYRMTDEQAKIDAENKKKAKRMSFTKNYKDKRKRKEWEK